MIRSGSALWLLPALASVAPAIAGATPPPPEPTALYGANQAVCLPRFAILLGADERAQLYPGDHLAVSGARLSLGIVVHPASHAADTLRAFRRRNSLQSVVIPGVGQAQRHPVAEWPGNRNRGWAYWLPLNSGASPDYVMIAADEFVGSAADYPVLRRVLTGDARRRICPHP